MRNRFFVNSATRYLIPGWIIPRTGVDPGSSDYSDMVQDGCSVIPGDNVTREGKGNTADFSIGFWGRERAGILIG